MATRTKLGAAGATMLRRRTGAEALTAATAPAAPRTSRRTRDALAGYKVTTIRFTDAQWAWLRREAFERSMTSGTKADASEIIRELVAAAMPKEPKAKGATR
jgi:hypothetical protein